MTGITVSHTISPTHPNVCRFQISFSPSTDANLDSVLSVRKKEKNHLSFMHNAEPELKHTLGVRKNTLTVLGWCIFDLSILLYCSSLPFTGNRGENQISNPVASSLQPVHESIHSTAFVEQFAHLTDDIWIWLVSYKTAKKMCCRKSVHRIECMPWVKRAKCSVCV